MKNSPSPSPLARAVQAQRKALNLTQAQVSQLAGVGPVFVHHLETGKPTLQLHKILNVLEVLGLGLTLQPSKQPLRIDDSLANLIDESK